MRTKITARLPAYSRPRKAFPLHPGTAIAALAVLALAAVALVGTLAAFVFIALAAALLALEPIGNGKAILRHWPLLILPLLCALSTLWSDAPQITLRAGLELLVTMVAGVIVAHKVKPRALLLLLFLGFLVICLFALPWLPQALANRRPPFEPFESKNALGFAAHYLFALSLFICCDRSQGYLVRLAGFASLFLALGLIWLSQSAGAQTSAAITLLVFPTLLLFGRVPMGVRIALVLLLAALLFIALVFLPTIEDSIAAIRSNVLHKDATLTGRTYLWDFAARFAAEHPLLGHGYYAFWRQGNIDAEGLWRWGGIASRSGFNFHNAFVEMRVDLGVVGVAVLAFTCAAIAVRSFWAQLVRPSVALAFFITLEMVLFGRSLGESGLFAPFGVGAVLLVAAWVYAAEAAPAKRRSAAQPRARRRARRSPAALRGYRV